MRKSWLYLCALCLGISSAQTVRAAGFVHFDVNGPTPSSYFNFDLAESPTPSSTTGTSFTLDNVTTNAFNTQVGFYSFQADYTFYLENMSPNPSGSFYTTARGRFYGDQLFSGPTTAPIFQIGDFFAYLPYGNANFADYDVSITETAPPPSVPEPATWALMLLGFVGVGATLRSRRSPRGALPLMPPEML